MSKKILFLVIIFLSTFKVNSQTFEWAKQIGGTSFDTYGHFIKTDSSGNIFAVGVFYGTVDFDPSVGVYNMTSLGSYDSFICKFDANGNFIWAKQFGGNIENGISTIDFDSSGNIYTCGRFDGSMDFDPSTSTYNLSSSGNYDIFISKLDSSGNFIWAKKIGATSQDWATDIAIDNSGNVYTTGFFSNNNVDFDPGPSTFNLSGPSTNIFINKLDTSGNFIWAKAFIGSSYEAGLSLELDSTGNIYTTGYIQGTTDFDPSPTIYNLTPNGNEDIFISKLDSSGNFVWAKSMGGSLFDRGSNLKINNQGHIYILGEFQGTVDFDPSGNTSNLTSAGDYDAFLSKFDTNGNFIWAKQLGGSQTDRATSLDFDSNNDVYLSGWFMGTADFDPSANTYNLTSVGHYDSFVTKFNTLGNLVWVRQFGGISLDHCNSIDLDNSNRIYTIGSFAGNADFDPDSNVYSMTSKGSTDAFIHKINQTVLGIEDNFKDSEFLVYPNPTNETITISLKEVFENNIIIRNALGVEVYKGQIMQNQQTINLKGASGIYFIEITTDSNKSLIKKIIKI